MTPLGGDQPPFTVRTVRGNVTTVRFPAVAVVATAPQVGEPVSVRSEPVVAFDTWFAAVDPVPSLKS